MLVWKAISSIVRMMRVISSLDWRMASIAAPSSRACAAPSSAAARVSLAKSRVLLACSALRAATPPISSSEAEVSSSEAAWALAPSAKDWLASETWRAAEADCSAPEVKVRAIECNVAVNRRPSSHATAEPTSAQTTMPTSATKVPRWSESTTPTAPCSASVIPRSEIRSTASISRIPWSDHFRPLSDSSASAAAVSSAAWRNARAISRVSASSARFWS